MTKRKPWMKPLRILRGEEPSGPALARPPEFLAPTLLALEFALLNAGAFVLSVAEVGSMSSLFGLRATYHLVLNAKEAIVMLGGGVFVLSLAWLLPGIVKGRSGLADDGAMFGFIRVMYLCVSFGALFACLLLVTLIAAWPLSLALPEGAAVTCGAILAGAVFALPVLTGFRKRPGSPRSSSG